MYITFFIYLLQVDFYIFYDDFGNKIAEKLVKDFGKND